VPYPPGIPMLMPGEYVGDANGPYLSYLRALHAWDKQFPGFGHDTHGVASVHGAYYVHCLRDTGSLTPKRTAEVIGVDEHAFLGAR